MVRRHPHVFGDRTLDTPAEALAQWEAIKQSEANGARRSVLHGIPRSLPGLLRAQRIQQRAARVGFDWPDPGAALDKVREETDELARALREEPTVRAREEVGDLLFAVVNVARLAGIDPEASLQGAIERFRTRFRGMEDAAQQEGRELGALTLEEKERLWIDAKAREREPGTES
jgi:tetrapyrrole methylase family protein/MazG family protein